MSYTHPLIGRALNHAYPGAEHISTVGGVLTEWPTDVLGPWPNDETLEAAVSAYLTYVQSDQAKDDDLARFLESTGSKALKAIVQVGIEKGLWTLTDLKAKYRTL